jgi:hypothetical protein
MNRCAGIPFRSLGARPTSLLKLVFGFALALSLGAQAQMARNFPATALRGILVVTAPPQALLNGRPTQLAPGARVHGANNMMQLSGTLVDQRLLVNYTLDALGQPLEIWVLRPDEAARVPWPSTRDQAQAWSFDAAAQTWTIP